MSILFYSALHLSFTKLLFHLHVLLFDHLHSLQVAVASWSARVYRDSRCTGCAPLPQRPGQLSLASLRGR